MAQQELAPLMQKALAGDAKAYAKLLQASARLLRPYIAKRIQHAQDAEDVLQETLLSIHKARHTFDGGRPYAPWAYAIAHYRVQDRLRQYYADPLRHADAVCDQQEENVTEMEITHEYIHKAIDSLPVKQAKILRLIHTEGYTAKEVAAKIGMKESAVKVAAHRAYKVLRAKIGNE